MGELFSDTYPMKLVDDCIYEVYGKHEVRKIGDVQLEGSNASAEEMEEGTEEASESGVDLVLNHRLVETGSFKKNINGVMKGLLGKFNDLQFYQGESMNPAAMVALIDYREIEGEERPVIMFFKHGLEEEKV